MIATAEYSPANIGVADRRVIDVPTELTDPDPHNERPESDYTLEDEAFAALYTSIQTYGIQEPLRVYLLPNGRFGTIGGNRRRAVAVLLKLPTVPVLVEDPPRDATDQAQRRLTANIYKAPNTLLLARTIQQIATDNPTLTQEELGQALGKKQTTVANYLRLLHLPPEVQALVADGQLAPSTAHELLGVTEAPINYSEKVVRSIDEEQVLLAQRAVAEGLSAKQVRALAAGVAQENARIRAYNVQQAQYTRQPSRYQAEWEEEERLRKIQQKAAKGKASPAELEQLAAAQAAAEAKAAKERAAAEREKQRLAAREQVADQALDALLGYDPAAPPNLEVLRLAAAVALHGAEVPSQERDAWRRRIIDAPDEAALLVVLAAIGRAALKLDSERRALHYILHWSDKAWIDARWGFNAAIAEALLAEKLINPRSYETLMKEAKKGPWPGRVPPAAPPAPAAPPIAAPPLIPPAPEVVAAWLNRCWAEQTMPACRLCGAESPDPAAYVQPEICTACAPTLAARYTVASGAAAAETPAGGRCDECGLPTYIKADVEYCITCDDGQAVATGPVRCARCGAMFSIDLDPATWTALPTGHGYQHPQTGMLALVAGVSYCLTCGPAVAICRICGCTQEAGCPPGCAWVTGDLCSACVAAPANQAAVEEWFDVCRAEVVAPSCRVCGQITTPDADAYAAPGVCTNCAGTLVARRLVWTGAAVAIVTGAHDAAA